MNLSSSITPQGVASPSRLLIGLPEETPIIKYINMEHLKAVVLAMKHERDQSPFLVFTDVPLTIVQDLEDYTEENKCHISADLVDRLLIIETISLPAHESMCRQFDRLFESKIAQMNLLSSLAILGAIKVEYGRFAKEPDCAWAPESLCKSYNRKWPTIAVEVGLSETIQKLAVDAQAWLEAEGSQVQIVLTIKIDRQSPNVIIQKWEIASSSSRRITRSCRPTAECTQRIEISPSSGINNNTGKLIVPFEKVFDRPMNPYNPQEQDLVFSNEDLRGIAEEGWRRQGFI